jgi:NAD-dependent oxidoreductase involved in siderophore biosynthesis
MTSIFAAAATFSNEDVARALLNTLQSAEKALRQASHRQPTDFESALRTAEADRVAAVAAELREAVDAQFPEQCEAVATATDSWGREVHCEKWSEMTDEEKAQHLAVDHGWNEYTDIAEIRQWSDEGMDAYHRSDQEEK